MDEDNFEFVFEMTIRGEVRLLGKDCGSWWILCENEQEYWWEAVTQFSG